MSFDSYDRLKIDQLISAIEGLSKAFYKSSLSIDEASKALKELSEKGINLKIENK